jgi:flagellar motor switch protein FliM
VTWLLPRKDTERLFESATGLSLARTVNNPKELVMTLPLDLVGVLGRVDLKMSSVANLKSGDILKLDQKIDEPLAVEIDDKELFRCWPGRVGKQQGLEIVSVS